MSIQEKRFQDSVSQDLASQDSVAQDRQRSRNPLLLLGGSALIGFAVVVLFFGGRWIGGGDDLEETSSLEQNPESKSAQSGQAVYSLDTLVEVGDAAHDFTLKDLDGNQHRLSELRGHPVVLNFWATWCAPRQVEMPELQAAFTAHQEEGLIMLALDYDEPESVVRRFFYEEFDLTFTPLIDEDGLVAAKYGIFNFPSTLFISPDGVVKAIHRGPVMRSQIELYLSKIIPNQT